MESDKAFLLPVGRESFQVGSDKASRRKVMKLPIGKRRSFLVGKEKAFWLEERKLSGGKRKSLPMKRDEASCGK